MMRKNGWYNDLANILLMLQLAPVGAEPSPVDVVVQCDGEKTLVTAAAVENVDRDCFIARIKEIVVREPLPLWRVHERVVGVQRHISPYCAAMALFVGPPKQPEFFFPW